jgi:hypothetical protein
LQIKTTNDVCSHRADSKPVKQEINCTVILPPLVFPGLLIIKWTIENVFPFELQSIWRIDYNLAIQFIEIDYLKMNKTI